MTRLGVSTMGSIVRAGVGSMPVDNIAPDKRQTKVIPRMEKQASTACTARARRVSGASAGLQNVTTYR